MKVTRYLGEVRAELEKASWPWIPKNKGERGFKRFKELTDSTVVVFIAMMLLGAFVSLWDLILFEIIKLLTHCIPSPLHISVIIPTYNERERLAELVHAITSVFRSVGIR